MVAFILFVWSLGHFSTPNNIPALSLIYPCMIKYINIIKII